MISIAYVTRHGCPACEAYELMVIEPLAEEYPGRVTVHATWDRLLERVNGKARITKVPLVVALSDGEELCRTATMPTLEELEDAMEGLFGGGWA